MTKTDPDLRPLVESLSDAEQAALPGRLRRLVAPPVVSAWADAKAERDAAIAVAYALEDPDEREAALFAARDAWRSRKAELQAEG